MSWFYRAGLTGLAVACLFTVASIPAVAKYPDDNGNHFGQLWNPGHHYGQLKHRQSPPPAPVPTPPASHPSTTGSSTSVAGAAPGGRPAGSPGGGDQGGPAVNPPAGGGPSLSPEGQIEFGASAPDTGVSWLVLLLVPALACLWVVSAARTAQRASLRWGRKAA